IVSENLAALTHMKLGDPIDLPTPTGMLHLPIVGIIRDLSNQPGTVLMDRQVYVRAFQDETVDLFRVYIQPGERPTEVRGRIVTRLGRRQHLFIMLNGELRDYVGKLMNQWFGLTYLQVLVATVVAILGIVNTLTVSIADRRRELGVLRAVGGLRRQIRGTI